MAAWQDDAGTLCHHMPLETDLVAPGAHEGWEQVTPGGLGTLSPRSSFWTEGKSHFILVSVLMNLKLFLRCS